MDLDELEPSVNRMRGRVLTTAFIIMSVSQVVVVAVNPPPTFIRIVAVLGLFLATAGVFWLHKKRIFETRVSHAILAGAFVVMALARASTIQGRPSWFDLAIIIGTLLITLMHTVFLMMKSSQPWK